MGVGQIADLLEPAKQAWQAVAEDWFQRDGDGVTHGAAGWLLRTWGLPEPVVSSGAHGDWAIQEFGGERLTLIRIPAGTLPETPVSEPEVAGKQVAECWIADRETFRVATRGTRWLATLHNKQRLTYFSPRGIAGEHRQVQNQAPHAFFVGLVAQGSLLQGSD